MSDKQEYRIKYEDSNKYVQVTIEDGEMRLNKVGKNQASIMNRPATRMVLILLDTPAYIEGVI